VISKPSHSGLKARVLMLAVLLASLLGVVLALRWTSLGSLLDVDHLVHQLRSAGSHFGPVAALASVALASIVAVPLGIIIAVASVAFGPWLGIAYAVSGGAVGGVISYGIGSYLGHDALCRLAGQRVNALSIRLGQRGVLAVVAIRMLPIAPFAIVNMIAGASHIRLRDFFIGTILGMLPGALLIALFVDQIEAILQTPSLAALVALALIGAAVLIGVVWLRRWFARRS